MNRLLRELDKRHLEWYDHHRSLGFKINKTVKIDMHRHQCQWTTRLKIACWTPSSMPITTPLSTIINVNNGRSPPMMLVFLSLMDDISIAAHHTNIWFRSIVNTEHTNYTSVIQIFNFLLLFNSFFILIKFVQKLKKINSYPVLGFVSGSVTTKGKLQYKTQWKTKCSLKLILENDHDEWQNDYLLWWLTPLMHN